MYTYIYVGYLLLNMLTTFKVHERKIVKVIIKLSKFLYSDHLNFK